MDNNINNNINNNGTLEQIIDEIIEHDKKHPEHGVGCSCMDDFVRRIRVLAHVKEISYQKNKKCFLNFTRVLASAGRGLG